MPSASNKLRDLMAKWFPEGNQSGIADSPPYAFLMARGWIEECGVFRTPVSAHTVSEYEYYCLQFLVDEWDYGCMTHKEWENEEQNRAEAAWERHCEDFHDGGDTSWLTLEQQQAAARKLK